MDILNWSKAAPGVWRGVVGSPGSVTPLSIVNAQPRMAALEKLPEQAFPFDVSRITVRTVLFNRIVTLPLEEDERIYGFGLQFMRVNQRGKTRYLRVNSDPQQDTGETHAPLPFYVSSSSYGVLVNTSRIVTVHCGSRVRKVDGPRPAVRGRLDPLWRPTPVSDAVEIVVPVDGFEIFVFRGETMLDVVCRHNLFTGGGVIPPRWGLGFWHRMPIHYDAEQVIAEAQEYRGRDFPCDVIGLEPGWHSSSYPTTYEWSPERFPSPSEFVGTLRQMGFRVNLWENPYVSPASKLYTRLEPLSGDYTVWGGLAPDYSLAEAQEIIQGQHREEHVAVGVAGYKLDECDGDELTEFSWMFPAHAQFPSHLDGEQMRQVYGLLLQKMTTELFRERDQRTYGLTRATNAGATSLPYVLYSDLTDCVQYVRALCNASFSGLLWCPEISVGASAQDWVRRVQLACFSPLAMLNSWESHLKPWSYPEVEHIVRKFLTLRMRLIPYLYSAFARYYFDGIPPFRAMALEFAGDNSQADPALLDADDQFMVGESLLVAPLLADQVSRAVLLPSGIWYDFETGERFEGDRTIHVSADLGKMPLFVRDGGIIPLMQEHADAQNSPIPGRLEVRHYGTKPGRFELFEDDGETFAYERGAYQWRTIDVSVSVSGIPTGKLLPREDEVKSIYGVITWNFIR